MAEASEASFVAPPFEVRLSRIRDSRLQDFSDAWKSAMEIVVDALLQDTEYI
jgi:hypothetical protein